MYRVSTVIEGDVGLGCGEKGQKSDNGRQRAEDAPVKPLRELLRSCFTGQGGRKIVDSCGGDGLDDSGGWMKGKGPKWPRFHSTFDIIRAVEAGRFPDKAIPVKSAPEKQEPKRVSRGELR
jgi:hypothetical protein